MSLDIANMPTPTTPAEWARQVALASTTIDYVGPRLLVVTDPAQRDELEEIQATAMSCVFQLAAIGPAIFSATDLDRVELKDIKEASFAALEDAADAAAYDAHKDDEAFPIEMFDAIDAGESPIAAFRKHRKMTQAALAKTAGSSAQYISQIERGQRHPGRKLLHRLAGALDVEPGDLL